MRVDIFCSSTHLLELCRILRFSNLKNRPFFIKTWLYAKMGNVVFGESRNFEEERERFMDEGSRKRLDKKELAVDQGLTRFGRDLDAPLMYRDHAREAAELFFSKLHTHSKFPLLKMHYGGSFGKYTDVLEPDLDLTVVVQNLDSPSYINVLEHLKEIILNHRTAFNIQEGSIQRKSNFSIQFTFMNGYEVDLLPAANLTPDKIYTALAKNPNDFYSYNTSLVEKHLTFMKCYKNDHFTLGVIRLAKFWFKSLHFGKRGVGGGCTIMELICVAAAIEEEQQYGKLSIFGSALRTLRRVMDIILDIDTLKLAFEENSRTEQWRLVPRHELESPSAISTLVPRVVGTKEILARSSFIIVPANPFYDILAQQRGRRGNDVEVLAKLKQFATVTKDRLGNLTGVNDIPPSINFVEFFEPQGTADGASRQFPTIPDQIQIYTEPTPFYYPNGSVEICNKGRKEAVLKDQVMVTVKNIKWHLTAIIHSVVCEAANPNAVNVDKAIVKTALEFLQSKVTKNASGKFSLSQQEAGVRITIPFQDPIRLYRFVCEMSWKNFQKMIQ